MQTDVRAALAELVALKNLKDEIERWVVNDATGEQWPKMQPYERRMAAVDDYQRRKPLAWSAARAALAASPQAEPEGWQHLYRRAINEANGLTNYVEDRPELRSAERRITKIEEEARALAAAPKRTEG